MGAVAMTAGLIACASASTQTSSPNERVLATTDVGTVRSHDANAADSAIEATPDVVFSALAGRKDAIVSAIAASVGSALIALGVIWTVKVSTRESARTVGDS